MDDRSSWLFVAILLCVVCRRETCRNDENRLVIIIMRVVVVVVFSLLLPLFGQKILCVRARRTNKQARRAVVSDCAQVAAALASAIANRLIGIPGQKVAATS